jgi:L-lactate dehydrogenase complex protein LldF
MIEGITSGQFRSRARAALADEGLREALREAVTLFTERRRRAVAEVENWPDLREKARRIKEEALSHLDHHLDCFATRAEEAGAHVHWARDGTEACEIVTGIAERSGAERLIKSRSAVTEEIGLSTALQRDGRLPVETNLGDWIVQLAGESSSHLLTLATHRSRKRVAELFAEQFGIDPPKDVAGLIHFAREKLRRHFAHADLGISGVNFGIAETGSILLLENEGNVRMTTALPRVHVAVMGIEKVLPRLEHLAVFLRLLSRSAGGQALTSYQSLLTGPPAIAGDERPEELHIVLLDNGRSALLGDTVGRSSLACIRCGACLNACPVYREIGGHAFGSVYTGPIGSVLTPQLAGLACSRQLPFASSLCGACREVCPVKIDLPRLLLKLRADVVQAERSGRIPPDVTEGGQGLVFAMWAWAVSSPKRYRWLSQIARTPFDSNEGGGQAGGLAAKLAPALLAWTAVRDLHPLAPRTFHEIWRDQRDGTESPAPQEKR